MRELLESCFRHVVSLIGAAITTLTAILFFVLLGIHAVGFESGGYLGIVTFLVLPGIFALGLALIPLGLWLDRRRTRKAAASGIPVPGFPILNFNRPRVRAVAVTVVALTAVNLVVMSVGTYKGVQVMHSAEFCGATCHTPMGPEWAAYQQSTHSSVACVDCHVGSGIVHFAKSKLNGVNQLVGVVTDKYARPIAPPTDHMRPAAETCGHCHEQRRDFGDKLKVLKQYEDDEESSEKSTVMLMKNGGLRDGKWTGNHWHANPDQKIRYLADAQRQNVHTVELTAADGTKKLFRTKDAPAAPADDAQWRTMDCLDCHNRPAHVFRKAEGELDTALSRGLISRELPFIKREGLRLLEGDYGTHEEACRKVDQGLRAFYEKEYPDVAKDKAKELAAASDALGRIYTRNVFPEMRVAWNTYPDFKSHDGCYRCHDNEHKTDEGKKISKKCEPCHEVLATEEEDPEVLQVLYP